MPRPNSGRLLPLPAIVAIVAAGFSVIFAAAYALPGLLT